MPAEESIDTVVQWLTSNGIEVFSLFLTPNYIILTTDYVTMTVWRHSIYAKSRLCFVRHHCGHCQHFITNYLQRLQTRKLRRYVRPRWRYYFSLFSNLFSFFAHRSLRHPWTCQAPRWFHHGPQIFPTFTQADFHGRSGRTYHPSHITCALQRHQRFVGNKRKQVWGICTHTNRIRILTFVCSSYAVAEFQAQYYSPSDLQQVHSSNF